jgi:tetratricopeptide (TPR) repeat protein
VFGLAFLAFFLGRGLRTVQQARALNLVLVTVIILCFAAVGLLTVVSGPSHDQALYAWVTATGPATPSNCMTALNNTYNLAVQQSDALQTQGAFGLLALALLLGLLLVVINRRNASQINALSTQGHTLMNAKQYEQALTIFDQLLARAPRAAHFWNEKGYALTELTRHEEALPTLERALVLAPKEVASWNNKGWALTSLKRHEEALVALDQALALDPGYYFACNEVLRRCVTPNRRATPSQRSQRDAGDRHP